MLTAWCHAAGSSSIAALEGRMVHVALTDGSRLDACRLLGLPRDCGGYLWLGSRDSDVLVIGTRVRAVWEARGE